jgi:Uma2 family endonuclease
MPSLVTRRASLDDYLEFEREAELRHEYRNGEIVAMSGARINHERLVRNLLFRIQLGMGDRPCEVFSSNLKLAVPAANLIAYPDVMVVCGDIYEKVECHP